MRGASTIFLVLLGCAACGEVRAQSDTPVAGLLQRLPAPPDPKRTITFTYEFTRTVSKFKGPEEQLVAKLAQNKAQLERALGPDAAQRQETIDQFTAHYEAILRDGSTEVYRGQAEIAPDFRAVAEKKADDEEAKWDWTIQRGDTLSEYNGFNDSAHLSKANRQRETPLSLFMGLVGLFGRPSPYVATKLGQAADIKTEGSRTTVGIDHGSVVFLETPEGQFVLESFATWSGSPQTTKFEEYRPFGGVLLPTRITGSVSTDDVDIRWVYRIETAEIDGELTVPFKAARLEAN